MIVNDYLVAIESPLKASEKYTMADNLAFAERICKWALTERGVNPYAMHLFFTRFLDDSVPRERQLGIESGLGWTDQAREVWFNLREGEMLSTGMKLAVDRNRKLFPARPMRLIWWDPSGTCVVQADELI